MNPARVRRLEREYRETLRSRVTLEWSADQWAAKQARAALAMTQQDVAIERGFGLSARLSDGEKRAGPLRTDRWVFPRRRNRMGSLTAWELEGEDE